ncbi:MAG: prolipoprotein diacylglyceryl transferase [Clostridia bacterium]|nr:prolipoprotein diacylglyceryl transferase [Clostridia bacterium]
MPRSRFLFGHLTYYAVLIVSGMILAMILASREEKRLHLPKDTVLDLCLFLLPLSILGARLYYVIFSWEQYRTDPLEIFAVWEGGLAIYGGIIAGFLTVIIFSKWRHLSPALLLDVIIPGVPLAQAMGRWGNYFNMEAYGAAVSDPRFQFFPFAVQIADGGQTTWHLATFFYESVWDLLVFLLLYFLLRKRKKHHGDLFLWYLCLYATGRMLIEELRTDSLFSLQGTFRVSQLLSMVICLCVSFIMLLKTNQRRLLSYILFAIQCILLIWMISGRARLRAPLLAVDALWGIGTFAVLYLLRNRTSCAEKPARR